MSFNLYQTSLIHASRSFRHSTGLYSIYTLYITGPY